MYKKSEFTKTSYKTGEVAKLLGVTTKTIQNYDAEGKIKVHRTENNRRSILREDLFDFLDKHHMLYDDMDSEKRDVIYARVSSHDQQKHGDLDRQALFLVEHSKSLTNPLILKEVGSGLNDNRKELQKLIKMVCNNEVNKVYITYKDRLTRFGYRYLETVFSAHNTEIIVVNDDSQRESIPKEFIEDMIALKAKADDYDNVSASIDMSSYFEE